MKSPVIIDLRSDTVTRPSPAMLDAMFSATVGDDVFEEDPTVHELEKRSAALFGMEAGLFVASGTMANQISVKLLTRPQDEVICDKSSHIYYYEAGGVFSNSGISIRFIEGKRGIISSEQIEENLNPPENIHLPLSRLVAIENTSNKGGGSYYTYKNLESISRFSRKSGLSLHLDGARIFNALTETGDTTKSIGKLFDTVSFCLSKGLGAPVGSMIISTKENILRAKRIRKAFGGAMRQAGYLAAAGIYALDNNISRLKQDHLRASKIASLLKKCTYVADLMPVETNIIVFSLKPRLKVDTFLQHLKKFNIKAVPFGKQTVRMVTHLDITDNMLNDIETALLKF